MKAFCEFLAGLLPLGGQIVLDSVKQFLRDLECKGSGVLAHFAVSFFLFIVFGQELFHILTESQVQGLLFLSHPRMEFLGNLCA